MSLQTRKLTFQTHPLLVLVYGEGEIRFLLKNCSALNSGIFDFRFSICDLEDKSEGRGTGDVQIAEDAESFNRRERRERRGRRFDRIDKIGLVSEKRTQKLLDF